MKKVLYLVMAAVVMFGGCKTEEESNKQGGIHGVVTDRATGEPIKSASVELQPGGTKYSTGDDGHFEITEIKEGSYELNITKTGYAELLNYKVSVESGKTTNVDIPIEKLPAALRITNDKGEDISELNFGNSDADITRLFNIFNDSPAALKWQITTSVPWISNVSETSGELGAGKTYGIIVTIDRDKLVDGKNTTTMHITSDNGNKALTVIATKGDSFDDYIVLIADGIMVQKYDISSGADWNTAKSMCESSRVGGFSDWRLPTMGEFYALCEQKDEIGGFKNNDCYWSSTEYPAQSSQYVYVCFEHEDYDGGYEYCDEDWDETFYPFRVRAVRSLP